LLGVVGQNITLNFDTKMDNLWCTFGDNSTKINFIDNNTAVCLVPYGVGTTKITIS
jgi:hypothetical protein